MSIEAAPGRASASAEEPAGGSSGSRPSGGRALFPWAGPARLRRRWIRIAQGCAPLLLFVLAGCLGANKPAVSAADARFRLSDSLAGMIRVDTARMADVESDLNLTGKVAFDEDQVIKVYPPVGGAAVEVKAELGDYVQKGAVLAVIKSADVAGYEQQRIAAEANEQIAKKNLEAAEDMHATGVASEKDLITAQREYAKAQAEAKRMREIYSIYDLSEGSGYLVKAPISGFIVEKKINKGMQLRPDNSDNLFTISNLDEVWVTANIYETDIGKVKAGYDADVTTLSYEGKVFKGKVDKVFNVLDPETKVMKVRIRLPNPGYLLKPEMFASVDVHYKEGGAMTEIPEEAVIFDKSRDYVVVYRDRSDVETREVKVFKTAAGRAWVSAGINPGERVISRYHLLVYDELNGG
jgi:cobalt-zinc-cadmium efflux system membrane fusion protein